VLALAAPRPPGRPSRRSRDDGIAAASCAASSGRT